MTAVVARPVSRQSAGNHHPLVVVLAAACAGIVIDRFCPLQPALWLAMGTVCLLAWFASTVLLRDRMKAWRVGDRQAAAPLLLAVGCLAGTWHHQHWHLFPAHDLANLTTEQGGPFALRAVALNAPTRRPAPAFDPLNAIPTGETSQLKVQISSVRSGDRWQRAGGQAMLTVQGHLLGVGSGDELQIFGYAVRSAPPGNPGEMDLAAHARADRRRSSIRASYPDCVAVLRKGPDWTLAEFLTSLRRSGQRLLNENIGYEQAGLAAALLLGAREQLDDNRTAAFFQTNTIHFLAISGLHVGILAGALFFALRTGMLPRRAALIAVALCTMLYALLTGAPPSALRATVLVVLVCMAMYIHRPTLTFNSLAAAALVILICNPADLFRTGPQLSFLAVGTLAWFGPHWLRWREQDPLDRLIARSRAWPLKYINWLGRWFLRAMLVTAVVWLTTLPLVMARFHLIAPVAIPLSTLLTPPIAVALLSGFGVLLLGWLVPPLGELFGWICNTSLAGIAALVTWAADLPYSHAWVAGPPNWWLIGFYGGLLAWAAAGRWRPGRLLSLAVLAVWIVIGLAPSWVYASQQETQLRATFIDMNHGCAVLIETPDGKNLLYDAGRLGWPRGGARGIAGVLWERGATHLDAVILSHADVDHYNALPYLLDQFSVETVYVSPMMFRERPLAVQTLEQSIANSGAQLLEVHEGCELLATREYRIDVLHPPPEGIEGSDNANSVVLNVESRGHHILLTGDLEGAGMNRLLATPSRPCDVMLVPHHGSSRSNPPRYCPAKTTRWR